MGGLARHCLMASPPEVVAVSVWPKQAARSSATNAIIRGSTLLQRRDDVAMRRRECWRAHDCLCPRCSAESPKEHKVGDFVKPWHFDSLSEVADTLDEGVTPLIFRDFDTHLGVEFTPSSRRRWQVLWLWSQPWCPFFSRTSSPSKKPKVC